MFLVNMGSQLNSVTKVQRTGFKDIRLGYKGSLLNQGLCDEAVSEPDLNPLSPSSDQHGIQFYITTFML